MCEALSEVLAGDVLGSEVNRDRVSKYVCMYVGK